MLCSESELGISEEHDGIMVLDSSLKAGTPIKKVLGPIFNAIDIEVTPDKAFGLSHRGIAREVATMVNAKLKTPISAVVMVTASNVNDVSPVIVPFTSRLPVIVVTEPAPAPIVTSTSPSVACSPSKINPAVRDVVVPSLSAT